MFVLVCGVPAAAQRANPHMLMQAQAARQRRLGITLLVVPCHPPSKQFTVRHVPRCTEFQEMPPEEEEFYEELPDEELPPEELYPEEASPEQFKDSQVDKA